MPVSRPSFASVSFSVALLAAACETADRSSARDAPRTTLAALPGPGASMPPFVATSPPSSSVQSVGSGESTPEMTTAGVTPHPAIPDPYLTSRPLTARSIGHTSYVLKVKLDNGLAVAYKPRSKLPLGDRRYRGEIAAYRLGRALGLSNVPCAMPRIFAASELRATFTTKEAAEEFDRMALVEPTGILRGALIPWIDRYEEVPLEKGAARMRWERWLTDAKAEIPLADRPLARALSTMLVFDYLTANWDRWSGGNVVRDGATGTLLFVDNDGAFYDLPPQSLARQAELLQRVLRFSRSLVAALRDLDASTLRDVFGNEDGTQRLLPDQAIEQVNVRRRSVLAFIDAATTRWGEGLTLSFE